MTVGGKDERHVEPLSGGIQFGLCKAVSRGYALGLRFNKRDGDGLSIEIDLEAESVVYAPFRLHAWLTLNDLNSSSSFLSADQIFGPPAGVDSRIDKLCAGIGFVQPHPLFFSFSVERATPVEFEGQERIDDFLGEVLGKSK